MTSPLSLPNDPRPVLVAVGSEAKDLRLVHAAYRLAREQGRPWVAVHIHVPDWASRADAEQARCWLQEAVSLGAGTEWIKAPSVSGGLLEAARKWQPSTLLLGQGRLRGVFGGLERTRTLDLLGRSLDSRVLVLPLDGPERPKLSGRSVLDLGGLVLAVLAFLGMTTLLASASQPALDHHGAPALFALALAFIAHRWGPALSVPFSVVPVALYEIFLRDGRVDPFSPQDLPGVAALLGAMMLAQLFVGLLDRLRRETRTVRRMEAETALLMLLGRALSRCTSREEVATVLDARGQGLLGARTCLLVPAGDGVWKTLGGGGEVPEGIRPEDLGREDTLEPYFAGGCSFLSLGGGEGCIQVRREDGRPFPAQEWSMLLAFAGQAAVALERIRWHEAANREKVDKETERMRNTLLGAVSHDLRTPLAAIQGAATSLLLPEGHLPCEARKDLLVMIREESERLARFLGDLLDLTRLQSGAADVRRDWQPLDEVVGSALGRLERRHGPLAITVDLARDLPVICLDGGLMEQVLLNLLGNALRHAPGSPVEIRAWAEPGTVEMAVRDHGPGIPAESRRRVFDKFFRLPGTTRDGGAGLGLAICEAILTVHGGRIWVEEGPGGGACIRMSLPQTEEPPVLPETHALEAAE